MRKGRVVKKIFSNGLRLVLVPRPSSLAATVLVLVEAGSEYETKRVNGLSHFLEHMCFKGTVKRPNHAIISGELASLGAANNAFTDQEHTGYWAKAQSGKLHQIVDIVSDLYLNPIFDPQEIEKERGVIIEELNMYEDTPTINVQNRFMDVLYGDQPAGWDIGGRKEVIRSLTRNDFLKYRSAHYVAPATAVIVAGAFDESKVERQVRELFGHLKHVPGGKKAKTVRRQKKPETLVKFKEVDQSHLVLGTPGFTVFDKRRYAAQVLADVLGGGMSSRLFHRVREDLGAAYYVRAGSDHSADHGEFSVAAGVDVKRIELVIKVILEELRRIRDELVPAKELQKCKDHMIGNFILSLETSDQLASYYGGQEIATRELKDPEELIAAVRRVTAEEVRAVARHLFKNENLNLAVIGPYKKDAPFRKILAL